MGRSSSDSNDLPMGMRCVIRLTSCPMRSGNDSSDLGKRTIGCVAGVKGEAWAGVRKINKTNHATKKMNELMGRRGLTLSITKRPSGLSIK